VIHLGVEQFHADGDAFVFGEGNDLFEDLIAVVPSLFVGHAAAVAGEGDDGRDAFGGGAGDVFAELFFDLGVEVLVVAGVGELAAAGDHVGHEAVLFDGRPIGGSDEVEALCAEAGGVAAHVFERHAASEAAAGDALADATFAGHLGFAGLSREGCGGGEEEFSAIHGADTSGLVSRHGVEVRRRRSGLIVA
jgi:hypothetical protein